MNRLAKTKGQKGRSSKRSAREKKINRLLHKSLAYTATPWGSSRWSELRKCTRSHHLRYDLGIQRTGKEDYYNIGGAVHSVLQFAAECVLADLEVENDRWLDVLDEIDAQRLYGARTEFATSKAEHFMRAYFATWGIANAGYPPDHKIIGSEELLRGEPGGQPYTTRVDATLLWHQRRGAPLLVAADTKTSASMPNASDEELSAEYLTDPQFLGHGWLLRERHGRIPTIMVNLIVKTQIPKFRRIYFTPTHFQLDRWASEHSQFIKQSLQLKPTMHYGSCVSAIGRKRCWAFEWCHGSEIEQRELFAVHHPRSDDAKKEDGER